MLRTPSIFGSLNSGFVPFSPAAPVDALADDAIAAEGAIAETQAAEVVERAAATPVADAQLAASVAPWAPSGSTAVHFVEGAVIAVVCGYFAWGLLSAFAGG